MNSQNILKSTFRFFHIVSGCFVIGNVISDFIWDEREETGYVTAYIVFYSILLVSGIVNIILLRPSKIFNDVDKRTWSVLVYAKLGLWLFFIPFPDWILETMDVDFPRKEFNLLLALAVLFLSIGAKTLRDSNSRKEGEVLKLQE